MLVIITLKLVFHNHGVRVWTTVCGLRHRPMSGYCENCNETSGLIKCKECID